MTNSNYTIPFEQSAPRCFVLEPIINQDQAYAQAGQHQTSVFEGTMEKLWNRFRGEESKVEAKLLHRRLVPFWHVHCTSLFDYNRLNEYQIVARNSEAVQVTIHDGKGQSIVYRVDHSGRSNGIVNLRGIERIVAKRTHEAWEDSYIQQQAQPQPEVNEAANRMQKYIVQKPVPITNLEELATHVRVDGKPLFEDDIETIIVPPLETAETIVERAMSKVMVSMEGPTINEAKLRLERIDLYFRPIFVFEFERFDKHGNRTDRKVEELDALVRNRWTTLSRTEFNMSTVPWKQILLLSADIGSILLQNVTGIGPTLQIGVAIVEHGTEIARGTSNGAEQ